MAAILGVLAMLVALGGPAVALAAAPWAEMPMGMAAMPDGQAPCQTADKACVSNCLTVGKCQHQCGSQAPFVSASLGDGPILLAAEVAMAEELPPPETASPVDGPPPRI